MSPRKRKQTDPLEQAIEKALSPGDFISYNSACSFVDDVKDVANDIGKIIKKEPERAVHLFELWLEKKESDRLMSRLRKATDEELEKLSHYRTEPLARKLERSHPDISARVYRALCMRIVNAGKSKYYNAALDNIEHAKKCYAKAGLNADWQAVVADIRERHSRKRGFMPGFEEIVSGAPKRVEPPFLERAKSRWPRKSKHK